MKVPPEITLSWQEVQMLLGERDVIIYQQQVEIVKLKLLASEQEKEIADLAQKREKRDGRLERT